MSDIFAVLAVLLFAAPWFLGIWAFVRTGKLRRELDRALARIIELERAIGLAPLPSLQDAPAVAPAPEPLAAAPQAPPKVKAPKPPGPPLLAHKASEEGVHCVERLAGLARPPLDHRKIPACIYTQPQVAWIGRTEAEARAEFGDDLLVGRFPFQASGKAVATTHTAGFVKILAEPRYREIVGAHVVGAGATELIAEIGLAMTLEATTAEIAGTSHAHPTLSEAILEAALAAEGRGINF